MLTEHEIAVEILQGTLLETVTKEIEQALIEALPTIYKLEVGDAEAAIGKRHKPLLFRTITELHGLNSKTDVSMQDVMSIVAPYIQHYSILKFHQNDSEFKLIIWLDHKFKMFTLTGPGI